MRLELILAALLAVLPAPAPALADVTARYSAGKATILVEVDDGGNSRIGMDGKFAIIRRDSVDYVVAYVGEAAKVAELDALLAVLKSQLPSKTLPRADEMRFTLTAMGEASIAGRSGTRWGFGPVAATQPATPIDRKLLVVVSRDADLAPVGAVFLRLSDSLLGVLGTFVPESTGFALGARELLGKGTPLSLGLAGAPSAAELVFQSADTADIDHKRFELPAPVLTAGEFMMSVSPSQGAMGEMPALP